MYQNIIFIGGIHGVGKGTVCSKIQKALDLRHLTASEVLKWSEVSPDLSNKLVKDIPNTQERLIRGLENLLDRNYRYILDGHFCLFDSNGKVKPVPIETFFKISPIFIVVVTCNVSIILERLEERDHKKYNLDAIEEMQNSEVSHGQLIAKQLGVPFLQLDDNFTTLIEKIKSL